VPQWAPNQCTDICFHNHNGFHGGLVACLSDFKGPRPCGKCFTVKLKPKPVPHLSSACQALFLYWQSPRDYHNPRPYLTPACSHETTPGWSRRL
jgi:hypothetical protein